MTTTGYVLIAPLTPGVAATEVAECRTLWAIRAEAAKWVGRADLKRGIDLRIDRCLGPKNGSRDNPDGRERRFVEYY